MHVMMPRSCMGQGVGGSFTYRMCARGLLSAKYYCMCARGVLSAKYYRMCARGVLSTTTCVHWGGYY